MALVNLISFSANDVARASDVMGNFQAIANEINGGISSVNLQDNAVTTGKLASGSVTAAKLAANSVGTSALQGSSVTTAKLLSASVTTDKLADKSVTQAKLATNSVNANNLQTASVGTPQLVDASVTNDKIPSAHILLEKFAPVAPHSVLGNITAGMDTPKSITGAALGSALRFSSSGSFGWGKIDTATLDDSAVTSAKLANGAVTSNKIGDGAVTVGKVAANSINNAALQNQIIEGKHLAFPFSFFSGGVGTVVFARWTADGSLTDNSYTSGANLRPCRFVKAGDGSVTVDEGSTLSGSWRNISGMTLTKAHYAMFLRVS